METQLRYCLYARKSTEQDELQALSIESQIKEMMQAAERDGIYIGEVRRESHSAKDSGERPVYNELIKDNRSGKFNAILTWATDRLSRNAGDLGALVDLMDQGKLQEIRTHGQTFHNSPNEKFLLMILGSQAKLENDNRGVNVKRGLRTKCEMGWRPGVAPLGYLNQKYADKGDKKVILDPERAPFIRQMFERVVNDGASGRKLYKWAYGAGFRTRSGKRVTLSSIYKILGNPFYTGRFEYPIGGGIWYEGGYEAIIDRELYDEARSFLEAIPKGIPGTKEFAFTKLFKCGRCGSGITAEEKIKRQKSGAIHRYVYYHCSKNINMECPEPWLPEHKLVNQLLLVINSDDINQIKIRSQLSQELARFNGFAKGVLGEGAVQLLYKGRKDTQLFADYILREGTKEDKRLLISCLKYSVVINDGKLDVVRPFDSQRADV